jgi:SAM domain (Sterile alpha motif)
VDIADWLRGLGLEHCEQALRDHEIDQDILLDLTEGDLATLGLPLGSRKKLLKAIEALRQGAGVFDPSSALSSAHVQEQRSPSLPTAERRQLTVVFCDLVGSTALS